MEKISTILAYVGLAVLLVGLGYVGGRHSKVVSAENAHTTTDTIWTEVHDTAFVESAVNVLRTDTVRLAYVPDSAVSGTYQTANGYENGISGTHRDTLILHDSVFVEIPIERKTFEGENWRVTAHGYGIGLDEVWFSRPTVYVTKTNTKTKRWAFNVGAQMGYGYTVHGASPYIGLGVGFGYTF